ncbi:MAG TPA: hypothetical protein VLI54_03460 [Bacillota bacterium]|nr:hypothetical protein [Bacillota bacterium]
MLNLEHSLPADPRQISVELLGLGEQALTLQAGPLDLARRSLPCGLEACAPLSAECVQIGPNPDQARIACARQMGLQALGEEVEVLSAEAADLRAQAERDQNRITAHEVLIRQLSVDSDNGILTRNAQDALFDRPEVIGILERMRAEGYTFVITIFDMDKLKIHNLLGGHDKGGDPALHTTITTLKRLFRRGYDVMGILEAEHEAGDAVQNAEQVDIVSRFERGDEMTVMSFIPPGDGVRQGERAANVDIEALEDHIDRGFERLEITYPLRRDISEAAIAEARDSGLRFVIQDTPAGKVVRASVSVTYSGVIWQVPIDREQFERIASAADSQLMLLKDSRETVATAGSVTDSRSRPHKRLGRRPNA